MKEKTCKTVRIVYGAVFGAVTALVAALLIWQVLDVYLGGKRAGGVIFSRAVVGERLARISPALIVWLVVAVAGYAIGIIFSTRAKVGKQDIRYTLCRMRKRMPVGCPEGMGDSWAIVRRETTIMRILYSCVGAVGLAGAIYTIVYLCMPSHFPSGEVTASMINMVKNVIPWVTWTFLLACGVGVYEKFSARKQIPEIGKLTKAGGVRAAKPSFAENIKNRFLKFVYTYRIWFIRGAVCVVAVSFVIAGALNGGAHDVLTKAINICTECIGLG